MTIKEQLQLVIERLTDDQAVEALMMLVQIEKSEAGPDSPPNAMGSRLSAEELALLESARPLSHDDPIFRMIGLLDDDRLPADLSANHDKYLAEAYADLHEEP